MPRANLKLIVTTAITAILIPSASVGQSHQTESTLPSPKQAGSHSETGEDRRTEPLKWRGRYTNIDYGFSVRVPAGFVGEGNVPPNPNHGFVIRLGEQSMVWVDASYENTPDSPYEFGRFKAKLGALKAERQSWADSESGAKLLHCSVVARGYDRETPIIYTIRMDTNEANRDRAMRVFDAVVNSFRQVPVRP